MSFGLYLWYCILSYIILNLCMVVLLYIYVCIVVFLGSGFCEMTWDVLDPETLYCFMRLLSLI